MPRTYLVELQDSLEDPLTVAADIEEELLASGFDVNSVKPWAAQDTKAQPFAPVMPALPLQPPSSPFGV